MGMKAATKSYVDDVLRAAPEDPEVVGITAYVLGRLGDDLDVALSLVDRALALNPSFALGWYWSGLLQIFLGLFDDAGNFLQALTQIWNALLRGIKIAGD